MIHIPRIKNEEIITACAWARADAQDDFCPDYIRYADYGIVEQSHIQGIRAACLRPDIHPLAHLVIPRGAGLTDDDFALAQCDELLIQGTKNAVEKCFTAAAEQRRSAVANGKSALVRAYGSRLLRVAEFSPLRSVAAGQLEPIAVEGFQKYPGEAEHWARFAGRIDI